MSRRQRRRKRHQRRLRAQLGIVGSGAVALTLACAGTAEANQPVFKVTSLKDSGPGTLRSAIENAEADASETTPTAPALITFASGLSGSIDLTSPLPEILGSVDIRGPGAQKVTINAAGIGADTFDPVIYDYVSSGDSLTISGLSLDDSVASGPALDGGFIGVTDDTVDLQDDTFSHDSGTASGAVVAGGGSLTIDGCTFSHDKGTAETSGAVYVGGGRLTIDHSTFSDDSALVNGGGAVWSGYSTTTISDSTFTGNSGLDGGAVYLHDSPTVITATTITGNHAIDMAGKASPDGYGGGIALYGDTLTLDNTIVAGNTQTGNPTKLTKPAKFHSYSDLWVNTVGTFEARFSLIQQSPGDFDPQPGTLSLNSTDITGKAPDLNPLAFNGGPTETELPRKGSPVINAGKAFGLTTDQRGDKRTVDYPGVKKRTGSDGTDIGAVELQKPKPKPKKRR